MKRFLIVIGILAASTSAFTQSVRVGIQGGLGLPSIQSKAPLNRGGDYKMSVRFVGGLLAEVKFNKFAIQPGLLVAQKGNIAVSQNALIANGKATDYKTRHTVNLTYIELPVNFLFFKASKHGNFYYGAGPYAALAVDGFVKDKTLRNNYVKTVEKTDVEFGEGAEQIKREDFGLNVLGGIRLKNNLDLGLSFSAGLVNLSNTGTTSSNRVASVKVGYFF